MVFGFFFSGWGCMCVDILAVFIADYSSDL